MKPFYFALLSALVWGFAPIVEKIGLSKIPAVPGLFFRSLGVFAGAVILWLWKSKEIAPLLGNFPQGWGWLVFGGFLASIVGQIFFYQALKNGDVSMVVPVGASYPLITFILGIIFLGEKFTLTKAGGLLLVILGVLFLKI